MGNDNSKKKQKDPFAVVTKKKFHFLSKEELMPGKKELKMMETHFENVQFTNPEDKYEIMDIMGHGSYGVVHKVCSKEDQNIYAAKIIKMTNETQVICKQILKEVKREIDILKNVEHENIVKFHGFYYFKTKWWIVLDFCDVCIVDYIEYFNAGLTEEEAGALIKQLLEGMAHIFRSNIIHRDVKAANILITKKGKVKLADFGVAAQLVEKGEKRKSFQGSPCWMSPEVIAYGSYGRKADVWSLGITIIELVDRFPPYYKMEQHDVFRNIQEKAPPGFVNKKKWSKGMRSFLKECLNKDPNTRWTPGKLLDHPWIKKVKKEKKLLKPLVDRMLQAFEEAGGKQHYIKNYEEGMYKKMDEEEGKLVEDVESSSSDEDEGENEEINL